MRLTPIFVAVGIASFSCLVTTMPAGAKEKEKKDSKPRDDSWLDTVDVSKLDPESRAAIMESKKFRQWRVESAKYKKYDNVNPKFDPKVKYTNDFDLNTPLAAAPEFGPWVQVGKQKVREVLRVRSGGEYRMMGGITKDTNWAGLENEKGKVLLPCVFAEVHVIPGRGVFLRSHLRGNVYESYDIETKKRADVADIIEIQDRRVDENNTLHAIVHPLAERIFPKPATPFPGKGNQPDSPATGWPTANIEFVNGSGENYLTLDRVAPVMSAQGREFPWEFIPRKQVYYWVHNNATCPISPSNDVAMLLLNSAWQPRGSYIPRALLSGDMGLIVPSPFLENCWLRQAPGDQSFGSPLGTLGYMPIGYGWEPESERYNRFYGSMTNYIGGYGTFWALAYQTDEGLRWGWIDPKTRQPSGPVWKNIRHITSPILKENWALHGPVIAIQELDGKWRTLNPNRDYYGNYNLFPPKLQATTYTDEATMLDSLDKWSAQIRADKEAREKAEAHYWNVVRPRLERERRWTDAWASGSWSIIQSVATSMGGDYYLEFIDKYPTPSPRQLELAISLTWDPAKKQKYQQAMKAAEDRARREEAERKRAQEEEERRQAAARQAAAASRYAPSWNNSSYDSWATWRNDIAATQQRTQAIQDWTYGRTNNPYLNPLR